MRRDPEEFGDQELELIYIARKLNESLRLEDLLTDAGIDYAVEADNYQGGVIFRSQRVGAFFYVRPESAELAKELVKNHRFR